MGRSVMVGLVVAMVVALLPSPASSSSATSLADREIVPSAVLALTSEGSSRILVVDDDGAVRVLTAGAVDVAPVASPDGSRAAFVRLPAVGAVEGELGLVGLDSGQVVMTGIDVDRSAPLLWEHDASMIATTAAGVVRIRPDDRDVAFVAGTAAGQLAHDVMAAQPMDGVAPAPPRILASRQVTQDRPLQLIELTGEAAPTVLWSDSEPRFRIAAAAYGPAGTIAFVPTVSSSGFGTQQHLLFVDGEGDVAAKDDAYGGDWLVNLYTGPHWQPDGQGVLFAGAGTQRFPGQEVQPATLLVETLAADGERTLATRPSPGQLQALGWRPDGSAAVALADDAEGPASLLVTAPDGEQPQAVALPGDLASPGAEAAQRFSAPDGDLLPAIRQVGGADRIATAVAVSQQTFPGQIDTGALADRVVLARADQYADALAGAPLARALDAPLLLTGRDGIDDGVAAEIARLGAGEAVLLGGTVALGEQVAADLTARGMQVRRVAGEDRFATAAAVAAELPATDRVVLVLGGSADPAQGWPDAVSAAPLAAAAGAPLLLTTTATLPAATEAALLQLMPSTVTVVGGPAAVSEEVATAAAEAADGTVQRIAGSTRIATSIAVAEQQIAEQTGTTASLWTATADDWPDALTAGPAVAAAGGTMVLADDETTDPQLAAFLQRTRTKVVRLIGGPGVIGSPMLRHLLLSAALGGPDALPLDVPPS